MAQAKLSRQFENEVTNKKVSTRVYEPGHEKICLTSYAKNKGADQTAHPRFVVRCLDSILSLDSIAEISRL